jgi:methylated-DNA-[protein]-cysteine S-methyltransferase
MPTMTAERPPSADSPHACVFDTALGACGIAWNARGITRFQLPEANRAATEQRLLRSAPNAAQEAPPPHVAQVIAQVRCYMQGECTDFTSLALDLGHVSEFYRQIYAATRAIPWGQTASYGDLARQVGVPGAARVVGQAMGHNPIPLIIPCHRVLASGGRIGGFSAYGGAVAKDRMLTLEGVHVGSGQLALPGLLSS